MGVLQLAELSNLSGQYIDSRNLASRGALHAKYASIDWFAWVFDRMGLSEGARVLDVGFGPAWCWHKQAARMPGGIELTLLDNSPGMVDEALENTQSTQNFADITGRVGEATDLPFAADSFDAVVLMHVLYHVANPDDAITEAKRVLKPGGSVFVTSNELDNLAELSALSAQNFGGEPVDRGAASFSLSEAEGAVQVHFSKVQRHDLEDVYDCTDPEDTIAYLLSMPPGNAASAALRSDLVDSVLAEFAIQQGVLKIRKRAGMVEGCKVAG